jgi:hypothetical protein
MGSLHQRALAAVQVLQEVSRSGRSHVEHVDLDLQIAAAALRTGHQDWFDRASDRIHEHRGTIVPVRVWGGSPRPEWIEEYPIPTRDGRLVDHRKHRWLGVVGQTLSSWDLESGDRIALTNMPSTRFIAAAISPNGDRLAVLHNGVLDIVDSATLVPLANRLKLPLPLSGHADVIWSPSGDSVCLVSLGAVGHVNVLSGDLEAMLSEDRLIDERRRISSEGMNPRVLQRNRDKLEVFEMFPKWQMVHHFQAFENAGPSNWQYAHDGSLLAIQRPNGLDFVGGDSFERIKLAPHVGSESLAALSSTRLLLTSGSRARLMEAPSGRALTNWLATGLPDHTQFRLGQGVISAQSSSSVMDVAEPHLVQTGRWAGGAAVTGAIMNDHAIQLLTNSEDGLEVWDVGNDTRTTVDADPATGDLSWVSSAGLALSGLRLYSARHDWKRIPFPLEGKGRLLFGHVPSGKGVLVCPLGEKDGAWFADFETQALEELPLSIFYDLKVGAMVNAHLALLAREDSPVVDLVSLPKGKHLRSFHVRGVDIEAIVPHPNGRTALLGMPAMAGAPPWLILDLERGKVSHDVPPAPDVERLDGSSSWNSAWVTDNVCVGANSGVIVAWRIGDSALTCFSWPGARAVAVPGGLPQGTGAGFTVVAPIPLLARVLGARSDV